MSQCELEAESFNRLCERDIRFEELKAVRFGFARDDTSRELVRSLAGLSRTKVNSFSLFQQFFAPRGADIHHSAVSSDVESICQLDELGFALVCKIFGRNVTFAIEAQSKVKNHRLKIDAFHIVSGFGITRILSQDDVRLGELQNSDFKLNLAQMVFKNTKELQNLTPAD